MFALRLGRLGIFIGMTFLVAGCEESPENKPLGASALKSGKRMGA